MELSFYSLCMAINGSVVLGESKIKMSGIYLFIYFALTMEKTTSQQLFYYWWTSKNY